MTYIYYVLYVCVIIGGWQQWQMFVGTKNCDIKSTGGKTTQLEEI